MRESRGGRLVGWMAATASTVLTLAVGLVVVVGAWQLGWAAALFGETTLAVLALVAVAALWPWWALAAVGVQRSVSGAEEAHGRQA